MVKLDNIGNVNFTTWRPFIINDLVHKKVKIDEQIPLSFASGPTADTPWSDRTNHGTIVLSFGINPANPGSLEKDQSSQINLNPKIDDDSQGKVD